MTNAAAAGPLAGLIVADFSRVLAGPYCTMLLGDLGATVVKVEGPAGDETRHWMPPTRAGAHGDEATYYLSVNRNKRAVTLDLHDAAGRATAQRLAGRADVMIENFKPGGTAHFGLDYASVKAHNPGVVYASISGWGPGSDLPGYDVLAQALSGLMSVTGPRDGEPTKAGVAIVDVVTGLHAAVGILAALRHREATGEGQRIEVNLLSSALSALVNQSGAYALAGVVPQRLGNDHPSIFPYGPFRTGEGELVIAVGNDGQFARLCNALAAPALAADHRYATSRARAANREELRPALEAALAARSARDWYDLLTAAGVPCAPILDVGEAFAWADELGLDPVVSAGADGERMPGVRHPISFSATPAAYPLAPPARDADRAWLDAFLS
ncbi:Crotonobetainyl-CoA:carnitine CoA-transferase CaiB [Microbacterium sp. cf046]|uniref:CaiB/BaiF CoA transferase family protein n=1 Tax=Microbacterium sp. cf046 TaxID=1761803 RepID=UPI0008E516CA|nr:CoA transferase [Microbacterium sp. cf046]SFR87714.1 Crotonobetainyl-CoA:carnitine CoA-transferase CaiB [Microbacterium sp. cf046]